VTFRLKTEPTLNTLLYGVADPKSKSGGERERRNKRAKGKEDLRGKFGCNNVGFNFIFCNFDGFFSNYKA
jgi:hypothetical protein